MLGGTGFVGRHLAATLVDAGYRVRIPTRNRERNRSLLVLPGVELLNADIHDGQSLSRLVRGCDAVVNLVGILHETPRDGRGFHRAHVALVEKAIDACLQAGVERYVQMSALKANADHGPSYYLQSKGSGERVIKKLAGDSLKYTILQPSVIFGPDDSFTRLFARLLTIFPVLPIARADARFAPVYVGDVAAAVAAVLADAETTGKTLQIYGPEILSLREIVAMIAKAIGKRRAIIGLPNWLGAVQAWVFDYIVPGRLLTLDNFRSLAVASVGTDDGLGELGIEPQSMRVLLPALLGDGGLQGTLSTYRQLAGR